MKILFCIDTMTKGGAERNIANIANYLSTNDEIKILTLLDKKCEYELKQNIELMSLNISQKKKNLFEKVFYTYKNIRQYIKKVKEINPDIIVSFLPRTSYYSILAAKANNINIIISIRNDPNVEYKNIFNKILMKTLYNKADGFVFQTKDAQEYFSKKIQKKSSIIFNSINESFIKEPYIGDRNKQIVTMGRLTEQKNQELLIKAFELVNKKYPDYELVIYGEGPLRKKIEKEINDKKLDTKIKLPGIVDNIQDVIYEAEMFVLSSNYEGMPNALMEAMALGIPVISTNCPIGGPKFLIENNRTGILIPIQDIRALAESIIKIIEDKKFAEEISINAHKRMLGLDSKTINERWKEYIYENVNKKNRRNDTKDR